MAKSETIHDKIDFRQFYPPGDDSDDERTLRCFYPEHDDASPSMSVNLKTGLYMCHGCQRSGNAITYARDILDLDYDALAKQFGLKRWIDPGAVRRWHAALLKNAKMMAFLYGERGLSGDVIEQYELGLDGPRVVIPIKEEDEYVNLRRYLPHAKSGADKMRNEPGWGGARLWPLATLARAKEIILCEGEMDALCLMSQGVPAVTGTGGAATWRDGWGVFFAGVDVVVCYDIDEAGQAGAALATPALKRYARSVRQLHLPLDPRDFKHGDITNYLVDQNHSADDLHALLAALPYLKSPIDLATSVEPSKEAQAEAAATDNPTVHDVPLFEASQAAFYMKRIRTAVIVSAKDTAPFFVPAAVQVNCQQGMKICLACPVSKVEGGFVHEFRRDDAALLALINRTQDQQRGAIKQHIGIPRQCMQHEQVVLRTHNIEEVRLVPQFNFAVTPEARREVINYEQHVVRRSFYVGHGIETNAPFRITARTVPEPQTQYATHLIYEAEPAFDSLNGFRLVPEDVRIMRELFGAGVGVPTVKRVTAALARRHADLEANVTHIWGRRALHLFVDLVAHSVLFLPMAGDIVKGYMEGVVVGDSAQGKSDVARKLQAHYGVGERVDVSGASAAGILGGLQETQKRWWVSWGIVPQNDRRWVILEEVKNAPEDLIAKLRDMRSSGIAEVARIEKQKTNARTRLLWISNPRGSRQIAGYDYGIMAIKELMGTLEDVRRFDMAMIVASGEVPVSVVNRPQSDWPRVAHRLTATHCRALVLWAWSREPGQITITPAAQTEILREAGQFAAEYSPTIPLVEPADQRLKLARVAAATAVLTFSADQTGERLVVETAHVQAAAAFLRECYNAEHFGYDRYSRETFRERAVENPPAVLAKLRAVPDPWSLVQGLINTSYLAKSDLSEYAGLDDRAQTDALVSFLVRARALKKYNTSYRKSPAFIDFLRRLTKEEVSTNGTTDDAGFKP